MASFGKLSELQCDVLSAFFSQEHGFYLSGGAALAGFHIKHRTTDDLDFFSQELGDMEIGRHCLQDVARHLNATIEAKVASPSFHRSVLSRGTEHLVIDLVHENVPQLHPNKMLVGKLRVDPPDEILANKLTALVGRTEERDIVDVLFLERSGLRTEDLLPAALRKDGSCTPTTLSWLLSEWTIPDEATLPAGILPKDLRAFISEFIRRLRVAGFPGDPSNK